MQVKWIIPIFVAVLIVGCGEPGPSEPTAAPAPEAADTPVAEPESVAPDPKPVVEPEPTPDPIPEPEEEPEESREEAAAEPESPAVEQTYVIASENLLKNGDLEVEAAGWPASWLRLDGALTLSMDEDEFAEGVRSVRVDLPADYNLGIRQVVSGVEGGAMYRLSGYIKTENVAGFARLEAQDADRGFQHFTAKTISMPATLDWHYLTVEFETPEDTEKLSVSMRRATGDGAGDGTIWYDALSLHKLAPAASPNLIPNAGFENPALLEEVWSISEGGAFESSDNPSAGHRSIALYPPPGKPLSLHAFVKVEPGKTYVLSGDIKAENVGGVMRLEVQDADKGFEHFAKWSKHTYGTHPWLPHTIVFTTPDDTTTVRVIVRRLTEAGVRTSGKASIWVDRLTFAELP